ncbi:MAG TPA: hypothetical protein VNV25_05770 [Gemmatimonadaceae bacterium]|jgi:hypothetical protein|nr:hypothetical protein [Gemmatimonadaceae bacterium]
MRVAVGLVVLVAACASSGGFRREMESWKGQPIDVAIEKWGAPRDAFDLSDGRKVMVWRQVTRGGNVTCKVALTTQQDTIRAVSYQGDGFYGGCR